MESSLFNSWNQVETQVQRVIVQRKDEVPIREWCDVIVLQNHLISLRWNILGNLCETPPGPEEYLCIMVANIIPISIFHCIFACSKLHAQWFNPAKQANQGSWNRQETKLTHNHSRRALIKGTSDQSKWATDFDFIQQTVAVSEACFWWNGGDRFLQIQKIENFYSMKEKRNLPISRWVAVMISFLFTRDWRNTGCWHRRYANLRVTHAVRRQRTAKY